MLNDLEDLISKLHECLTQNQSNDLAKSIVTDIVYICGENINNQTITFCLSIFFKRDKNLLTFLKKSISKDELRPCKVDLLQFLERFINSAGKQIVEYAPEIKDTCMIIFNSDKYSDVRCSTFPIIIKLLELTSGNLEASNRLNLSRLADEYFLSLVHQSKLSSSLKANILHILGIVCRYHPEAMTFNSTKCLNLFLNSLKTEMSTKCHKPDLNVIAGCLEGLNNYLYNFTQSAEEKSEHCLTIFNYTKQALLSNTDDLNRYAMPKAALDLFFKHASQFDEYIFNDYKDLFDRISQWAEHKNYEMKKLAYLTLDSYYKQLAEMLKKKSSTENEKCRKIFKYFIQKFYKNLTEDKDLKETVIAIKGYGAFAGPCREFMEPKDVKLMFNIIIDICERTFFLNQQSEIFDEKIYQLPSFIESLAYVCNQLEDNLPEGSVLILEKLVILSIDSYPKLIKRYNHQISLAIARLFLSIQLGSKSNFHIEFISKIIYQSLIRIFSYKSSYSLNQDQPETREEGVDNENSTSKNLLNITSLDYVAFWSNLFNLNEFKELNNSIEININDKKTLINTIYDELIESLIKIIKKLDLNAIKNENTEQDSIASSNPTQGLKPSRPKDFEILINLVDFSKELLIQKHYDLFEKWLFKFAKEVILLSSKNCLISSFYKLNTLFMRIAIKIGYFNNINEISDKKIEDEETLNSTNSSDMDLVVADETNSYEKITCFYLYKKYIRDIYTRMKQFKDELLASCIEFMLSLPKELVVLNLDQAVDALQLSLELGINYLPMADNALSSLEYWLNTINLNKLKPYYSFILSKFDDYLQINKLNTSETYKEKILVLKTGRKRLPIKLFEKIFHSSSSNTDLYEQIQFRILKIIGQLAGDMTHCLYTINQEYNLNMITWDTVQHLKFYVPFVDIKPAIYFDRFLPRIVYLALSSTNRQTKINACELLHAIVIYTLGKNVSEPDSSNYQMTKLYQNIYPALFRLACDVDHFARNLFQPLVMQMIHWFTGNRKYESSDTIQLLNCIIDCLIDEKDASLRDLGALSLKEFLKWSIKHTPLSKQDSYNSPSPVNVKSILKRIFNFLSHPSSSKRLGAALAWNSIYVIFREEELLVNKHIFELLFYLIESLALSEKDDKMLGTQEQCKIGLDHVERIIKQKKEILNQKSVDRVKPIGWSEPVLEVAVRWLMRQCGRIETECRHKSMELAYKLAPCITGVKDIRDYFQIKLKQDTEVYFLARFEGSIEKREILKDSLCCYKTLEFFDLKNFQVSFLLTWLNMLQAPLDCYTWIFSEKLINPSALFETKKTCIFISLEYFIKNISVHNIEHILNTICLKNINLDLLVLSPNEIEEFNKIKCTVIIRLIDFLSSMFNSYPSESLKIIPNELWNEYLFKLIILVCLDPARVGFSLNDLEVYSNLPIKISQILKILNQHLPIQKEKLKSTCFTMIHDLKEFKSLEESFDSLKSGNSIDWLKFGQLITGYEQLYEFGLYSIPVQLNRQLFDFILQDFKHEQTLSSVDSKRKLLNLVLTLQNEHLIEVIDKYLFFDTDGKISKFMFHYKTEISSCILKKYDFILKYLFAKLEINFAKIVQLLISLIEFIVCDKLVKKQYGSKVVKFMHENWALFKPFWLESSSNENKILLLNLITKMILIETGFNKNITEMYSCLITQSSSKLSFKSKLLDILYYFTEAPDFKSFMSQFMTQLPLKSSELSVGDNDYNDYVSSIRKLLVSLELSLSFDLLNIIVMIFSRENQHPCDSDLQLSLSKFIKRLESSKQSQVMDQYWDNWFISNQDRKFIVYNKIILNFLKNCSKQVFIDFMCKNIIYLINLLDIDLKENELESIVMNKKSSLEILELCYKRLNKDEIFSKNSRLCLAYETCRLGQLKDGKELTKDVLRKCRKCLSDELKVGSNFQAQKLDFIKDLHRQLNCSAYNCLVSLFIRTQTEPKLYLACLFKEDSAKNEFIFEPLIDKKKLYKFSIEIESVQERRTKFISLRSEFRENKDLNHPGYINTLHSTNSLNQISYLTTQNMFESSLSEELSIFDFTNQSINKSQISEMPQNVNFSLEDDSKQDMGLEIEIDDLNQHESMTNFIELIESLVYNKITPIYEQDQTPSEMPPWMIYLNKKISDLYTHENVKLFLIRALINTSKVFKPYAKFWYSSLISFLVNSASLKTEESMDYFTLDLMVLLLSWSPVCLPSIQDQKLINRLFEALIKKCYHENRAILKNNLELLKTMTECWRGLIQVPVGLINQFLISQDQKKVLTGIQLFGLVLSNQIEEYNYPDELEPTEFFKSLIKCMKDQSKSIHSSSSEVVGMLLKRVETKLDQNDYDQIVSYLFEILRELDTSLFITCVHRIQLNYPAISERCMSKLVFNLPQLYGEFKQMCAESILSSIRILDENFFKANYFIDMLTHRESNLQLVCLKMIYELLPKQTDQDLIRLLPHICDFIKHPHVSCRLQMILILTNINDIYQFKVNDSNNPNCVCIKKLCNETLLKGLLDPDQTIRLMAQNFWTEKSSLPSNTIDRMILLLDKMYSSQTESEYLSYSTNLLLEKTSKSPDYNRLIYENPLNECIFKEYNLTPDWRRRHEIMTPLFVDTFSSSLNESFAEHGFNLRQTQQSLQFQPTQDLKSTAYNWLTQSTESFQSFSETQSSLLFSVNKQTSKNAEESDILKLRRKFVRERTQTSQNRFFARKQLEKKLKEEELNKQMSLKRFNQVEKYRKYRIGDFPDIQIKYSELIAPLQALAQRDSQIAKFLFESLFISILSEVSYLKNEQEAKLIIRSIEANLNNMLNKSEFYNPNFVACLLEVSIKNSKHFRLEASLIAQASLNSLQQSLGIILLEEYLVLNENESEPEPPSSKKIKLDCLSNDKKESLIWIELAKLYRSMNDYDSIKGIFMKKSNLTSQFTKDGFYYESKNDYYTARKCYIEAIEENLKEDSNVAQIEKDLWLDSLLKCCNELTDWKMMNEWSTNGSNLNELFNNSDTVESLFSYAFRSKLKLILQQDIDEQKKHQDLIEFLNNLESDGKKYLEQYFCQEMAMINLYQKDINAAKYYAHLAIQKYLIDWSSINKTIMQTRITKLQSLQSIIELNEFLKFIDSTQILSINEFSKKCENLINLWTNSMPNIQTDPACTWDDIITNRCIFFEYIEDKFLNSSSNSILDQSSLLLQNLDDDLKSIEKNLKKKFEKTKLLMRIKFAQSAQIQGNHKLALNKLQQTRGILKSQSVYLEDLKINWIHCYLNTHLARSRQVNDPNDALNMFLNASVLKEILKYDSNECFQNRSDLYQEQQILHSNFSKFLVDSLINLNDSTSYNEILQDDKKRAQLSDYIKSNNIADLDQTVFNSIKLGVDSLSKIDKYLKGSLELASYCDYFLRLAENEEKEVDILSNFESIKCEFPLIIIEQMFNSMKLNSSEARTRFPRLLQIVELYKSKVLNKFIECSDQVPSWMFLGWLSQMTAILDKPEAKAIYKIIDTISDEYPQALIYPFRMSLDGFKFNYENLEQKEFVDRITQKLNKIPLINLFISSLEQLNNPNLLLNDYIQEINSNLKNKEILIKIFQDLYTNLIDYDDSKNLWGKIRIEFSKFIRPLFENLFGTNLNLLSSLNETEIKKKLSQINSNVNEYLSKHKLSGNLSDFSPWLKNFKRNLSKDLEIPGQYTGKSKPIIEYHVKIESFDERIIEMSSIRRPKCIIIRGDDQKDHKFLVKCGEDQRQDERIETLFGLINDLLKSDSKCYQRNLSIKTYQVIPMSVKLALIEWLPDTKPLKLVFDEDQYKEAQSKYVNFIYSVNKDESKKTHGEIFGMVYASYSRDLVLKEFDKIQNMVPWDLFRRFIRSLASCTESYFVLRNEFITSYAVASTCQYILGIGDRHLSNWMIDLKTGKAIGIDFGMAFGHATMNIPVPELIPIRLTRQILKLVAPLEHSGLFESSMYHTLKALRDNNDLLMCILDVFIKEPSIDWIGSAVRIAKKNLNEDMQYSIGIQYAKNRVNSVRNKLYGINPCLITKQDLLNGIHKDSKYFEYYLNVLLGLKAFDIESNLVLERAKLLKEKGEKYRLSVEEQVKCIIEQSTDLNILGRTWVGWQPFC